MKRCRAAGLRHRAGRTAALFCLNVMGRWRSLRVIVGYKKRGKPSEEFWLSGTFLRNLQIRKSRTQCFVLRTYHVHFVNILHFCNIFVHFLPVFPFISLTAPKKYDKNVVIAHILQKCYILCNKF